MGRLRFTLTNILFWIVLLLSCFLAENYALFSDAPRSGFATFPLYFLTFGIIALLVFYYILEHKKNGLSFDKILLPSLIMIGALMIWTIFRQGDRTFNNWDNSGTLNITFTFEERMLASLQVVIWLAVLYAIVFVYNRFRLNLESYRWIPKVYLIILIGFVVIDLFYEWNVISGIFEGTYTGGGVEFIFGNANVWALVIFSGIISALVLSYKKFNWYYFVTMICLFCYLILTSSATAIYISLIVLLAYPLYEIFAPFKKDRRKSFKLLIIYGAVIISIVGLCALFINVGVPIFANFWKFIDQSILHKDFLTITGRTTIWTHIIDLLKGNALDFIFGLGHQTGSRIYQIYNANHMSVKSAHNAVMEVFLRYGLLGVIMYSVMLISVFVCLGIHIKKKRYRFAFIYGLAYLAILAHSVAESTNIFTPNVGGVYLGLFFVLPVINILQSKKFKSVKEELANVDIKKEKVSKSFYYLFAAFLAVAIIDCKLISNFTDIDIFSCLVILILTVMSALFVLAMLNNKNINNINNNITYRYLKRLEVLKNEK